MSRQVTLSTDKTIAGKLRSILIKKLPDTLTLWKDGKLFAEYGNGTIIGVSLVFHNQGRKGNYPVGVFRITGAGRDGFLEFVEPDDKDPFDKALHYPAFTL